MFARTTSEVAFLCASQKQDWDFVARRQDSPASGQHSPASGTAILWRTQKPVVKERSAAIIVIEVLL